MDSIKNEYQVILERKAEKAEGSYTAYLFEQGLIKSSKRLARNAPKHYCLQKR
jgi:phosphoribosyl-ATP pyrophosphohydrolase